MNIPRLTQLRDFLRDEVADERFGRQGPRGCPRQHVCGRLIMTPPTEASTAYDQHARTLDGSHGIQGDAMISLDVARMTVAGQQLARAVQKVCSEVDQLWFTSAPKLDVRVLLERVLDAVDDVPAAAHAVLSAAAREEVQ